MQINNESQTTQLLQWVNKAEGKLSINGR